MPNPPWIYHSQFSPEVLFPQLILLAILKVNCSSRTVFLTSETTSRIFLLRFRFVLFFSKNHELLSSYKVWNVEMDCHNLSPASLSGRIFTGNNTCQRKACCIIVLSTTWNNTKKKSFLSLVLWPRSSNVSAFHSCYLESGAIILKWIECHMTFFCFIYKWFLFFNLKTRNICKEYLWTNIIIEWVDI